jgi:hypothetical protein
MYSWKCFIPFVNRFFMNLTTLPWSSSYGGFLLPLRFQVKISASKNMKTCLIDIQILVFGYFFN